MKYITILILLCSSLSLAAQDLSPFKISQPSAVGISSEVLEKMDKALHLVVDQDSLAGIQTAILKDGKLVHFDSYGFANIETGVKLDEQSIYRIFSMTKPIVSVALMQLVENGDVALEDPLSLYLPAFKQMMVMVDGQERAAVNKIKIIDLLRHSSGLGYGRGNNEEVNLRYREAQLQSSRDNKEYSKKVADLPLYSEPGTDWTYSISTNIVGALIEVISGKSLDEYLKDNILVPLEMSDTHFELPTDKASHFTVGYRWDNQAGLVISEPQLNNRYTQKVTLYNGGGGLVSTTLDYLKFCQMLINRGTYKGRQILKPETIDLMTKDHMTGIISANEGVRMPRGDTGFGLGFAVNDSIPGHEKGIYGWGGAVGTFFRIDPDNKMAYVMMIQLSPYRQLDLRERFQDFVLQALEN